MNLRIKELLREKGMRQTELAAILGKTEGYISNLSSGRRQPSPALLQELAAALDVRVPDLFADHQPNAMQEDGATFIATPEASLRQMCRLFATECNTPALYASTETVLAFGLIAGDKMLVDLNCTPAVGDLVVATLTDTDTGSTETALFRWADPWLIPGHTKNAPVAISDDGRAAILAVVRASFRN